jgi:simple sugar transport system permease protein
VIVALVLLQSERVRSLVLRRRIGPRTPDAAPPATTSEATQSKEVVA